MILVSGGGGGQKFGLVNRIEVFQTAPVLKESKFLYDSGNDLVVDLESAHTQNWILAAKGNKIALFEIDISTGALKLLSE